MKTVFKDTDQAPCPWWAAQDARMKSIANKSRYGSDIHRKVEAMKMVLDSLYQGKIYEAYNPKRVSVKVDKPLVRDRVRLREMEEYWATQGITKTVTPNGLLYRVI